MAAPAFRSAGTAVTIDPSSPGSAPLPSGWQAGDILVLAIWAVIAASSFDIPAGWTQFSSGSNYKLCWKRAGSSESAVSITPWGGEYRGAQVIAYSGCKASGSPFDSGISSAPAASSGTSVSTGSPGSTTSAEALISAAVFFRGELSGSMSGWANASLTSVAERTDVALPIVGSGFALATGVKATTGAVSAFTGTLSPSMNWSACAFALLPEPPITGIGAATLGSVVGSGSAQIALVGVGSATLGAVSSTGVGKVAIVGVGSAIVGDVTSVGEGAAIDILGEGFAAIGPITGLSQAKIAISGAASITIGPVQSTGRITLAVKPVTPPERIITVAGNRVTDRTITVGINRVADRTINVS